jgi:hypothetical protein
MEMRHRFPEACLIAVQLPELLATAEPVTVSPDVNQLASSFEEAAQHAIARFPDGARSPRR